MSFSIQKLQKHHHVEGFNCADESLNTYLRQYAFQNQERHCVGVTYVAVAGEAPNIAIGYYTLATSSFPKSAVPDELARRLSPYTDVPSLLLARLAVDKRFQKHGVGRHLLKDALQRCVMVRSEIGCRCLIVDAYPAATSWYQQFGSIALHGGAATDRTKKIFLDLRTVENPTL